MALDDGLDDALNIAGYWTLGVTKGFLVAIVPIAVMGLAFGMGLKVVKAGVQIGRVEMMGYLTDIAKTQALIVVAPGVVAGNWVVNRVYGDGTTDQLYEGLLPDAENFATNAAKDLGAMVLTIATEIGSALGDLGDDILKGLQSVGGSIGNATLDVARNIGPAIVDGVEKHLRLR